MFMLTQVSLAIVLAVSPLGGLRNDLARNALAGTWRVVAIESEDGKVTQGEQPGYKFVITSTTISLYFRDNVIWEAMYRVDVSSTPNVMYQTVTRAPCLSGARDLEATYSLDGNRLKIDSMLLEKQRPK
jgi:uncharacterized protein (TIGR03067 family)